MNAGIQYNIDQGVRAKNTSMVRNGMLRLNSQSLSPELSSR